jgi:hypothetical protein
MQKTLENSYVFSIERAENKFFHNIEAVAIVIIIIFFLFLVIRGSLCLALVRLGAVGLGIGHFLIPIFLIVSLFVEALDEGSELFNLGLLLRLCLGLVAGAAIGLVVRVFFVFIIIRIRTLDEIAVLFLVDILVVILRIRIVGDSDDLERSARLGGGLAVPVGLRRGRGINGGHAQANLQGESGPHCDTVRLGSRASREALGVQDLNVPGGGPG